MRSGSGSGGGSGSGNGWRATATATAPLSSYEFDFGIGSGTRGTSLKDQKLNSSSSSSSSSSRSSQQQATSWSWQQHQQQQAAPAPSQQQQPRWMPSGSGMQPLPMAGDITGKSWVTPESVAPSTGGSGVVGGVGAAKADMFSDLLGLSSVIKPKSSAPISVASLGSALPKGVPMKGAAKATPLADLGIGSGQGRASSSHQNAGMNFSSSVPAKPAAAPAPAAPAPAVDEDPFGDFVGSSSGTSSKQNGGLNNGAGGDPFGQFASEDLFAAPATNTFSSAAQQDPFAAFASSSAKRTSSPKPSVDPLEDLWRKIPAPKPASSSSSSSSAARAAAAAGIGGKNKSSDEWLSGLDDWDLNAGPDEEAGEAMTTELEGLPPPPAGVSASMARDKGADFQKQGQFADAIKWLTWAAGLSDSADDSMLTSILSCRVLCYKEVGEYKKAVEDCCKVLEIDSSDTDILLQRAFLYESMEKYKLGVQDLREVMRRDPSNRLAGNTLSRLVKMVD